MHKLILMASILMMTSFSAKAQDKALEFILSFNQATTTCDKISFEKAYDDDGVIVKLSLLDLAELGNEEFKAGVALDKFEFIGSNILEGSRFSEFNGKKVKEVFRFEKDSEGRFLSVSVKRFKRSFVRFTYPLGGIICRSTAP